MTRKHSAQLAMAGPSTRLPSIAQSKPQLTAEEVRFTSPPATTSATPSTSRAMSRSTVDQGATIIAADPASSGPSYDLAEEKTAWDAYQDYGHNHWHNSLIWGEGLENISILGPGLIWGRGLEPRLVAPAQSPSNPASATRPSR